MNLIDRDAIPWSVDGVGEIPVITKEEIDEMPVVEAIPIEFIMRKCEMLREMQLTCSDFDDESLWKSYMDEEHYLNLLMMTWQRGKTDETD